MFFMAVFVVLLILGGIGAAIAVRLNMVDSRLRRFLELRP